MTIKKLLLLTIGGIMLTALFGCSKSYDFSNIVYLSLNYSTGTENGSNIDYTLKYDNEQYIVQIKPNGAIDTYDTFIVDADFMKRLIEILIDNHVEKWNGFNKSDKRVLDGNRFQLTIINHEEIYLEASGYEKWPTNYQEVRSELDNLFNSLYTQK